MAIKIVSARTRLRLIQLSDLNSIHKLHAMPEADAYNALGITKRVDNIASLKVLEKAGFCK